MSDLKVDVNAGNLGVGLIDHIKSLDDRIGVLEMKSGIKPEAQGSGYTHGWDKGFAQEGDPYGIHAEYLPQSANPDAAKPSGSVMTSTTASPVASTGTVIIENPNKTFTLSKNGAVVGVFPSRVDAEKAQALGR
jgi:hypothetical protein